MTRRTVGLPAVLATLLALAPPGRAAEEGLQLGPVNARPALTVTEVRDDNVFLSSDDTTSDWITTVSPSLRLALPIRRFLLQAEGGIDFVRYAEEDSEDGTGWNIGASLGADFPGGLDFKVGGAHRETFLRSSQEFGPGEDSGVGSLSAQAGYRIRDTLRAELGWSGDSHSYDASRRREHDENTVRGTLFWMFRPRTSALVEIARTAFSYDSTTAQDNAETRLALGLTYDVTDRTQGLLKAGWEWKRFDDEQPGLGIEDATYFTASGGLRHAFTSRSAADVEIRRGSLESDFPENPYSIRTGFSAGVSHRFTWRLYGRAGFRYDRDAYPNATTYTNPYDPARPTESGDRTDTLTGLTAALGWDFSHRLALELGLGRDRRSSTFDTFSYTSNTVTLRARAAF